MENMVTNERPARQGDIWIERVEALPDGLVEVKRDEARRVVLALGESSGHAHALRDKAVTGFRFATAERDALSADVDYILVGGSGADLAHEYVSGQKAEHETIGLAPGLYRIVGQRSYTPGALRRAVD